MRPTDFGHGLAIRAYRHSTLAAQQHEFDPVTIRAMGQPHMVQLLPGTIEQLWRDFTAYRFGGGEKRGRYEGAAPFFGSSAAV